MGAKGWGHVIWRICRRFSVQRTEKIVWDGDEPVIVNDLAWGTELTNCTKTAMFYTACYCWHL